MGEDMGALAGGCAALLMVIAACVLIGGTVLQGCQENAISQAHAQAELERARAERETARSEQWQERFMVWTTALAAFMDSHTTTVVLLSAALGFAAAAIIIPAINRWIDGM